MKLDYSTIEPSSSKTNGEDSVPEKSPKQPGSPDECCSICLSKLENKSFTDSCFHTFCFICLVEWSKVRVHNEIFTKNFTVLYRLHKHSLSFVVATGISQFIIIKLQQKKYVEPYVRTTHPPNS